MEIVSPIMSGSSAIYTMSSTEITRSTSWTVPAEVTEIMVRIFSGGNGGGKGTASETSGGSYGVGGCGGGMATGIFKTTPGTVYKITIGAGGGAGSYYSNPGTGGPSSFGTLLSAFLHSTSTFSPW